MLAYLLLVQHTGFHRNGFMYVLFFCSQTKTFKVSFWMKHFDAPTLKRTVMISNRSLVSSLDRGKLPKEKRKCDFSTAKVYFNSSGKRCFSGSKFLKRTQWHVSNKYIQCVIPPEPLQTSCLPSQAIYTQLCKGHPIHGTTATSRRCYDPHCCSSKTIGPVILTWLAIHHLNQNQQIACSGR